MEIGVINLSNALLTLIKQAAVEAVQAGNPVSFIYGTVISPKPLQVKLDNNLILKQTDKDALIVCRELTDYEIEIEPSLDKAPASHWTEESDGGSGEEAFESHKHEIKGRKKVIVYNALKAGEKVIMFKVQGGNSYVIFDRVGVL